MIAPPRLAARPVSSATPPFAALDSAPGLARGYVKATLVGWGLAGFTDAAVLIASELVSNAVEASAKIPVLIGALVIRVCLITAGALLCVLGQSRALPCCALCPS